MKRGCGLFRSADARGAEARYTHCVHSRATEIPAKIMDRSSQASEARSKTSLTTGLASERAPISDGYYLHALINRVENPSDQTPGQDISFKYLIGLILWLHLTFMKACG